MNELQNFGIGLDTRSKNNKWLRCPACHGFNSEKCPRCKGWGIIKTGG